MNDQTRDSNGALGSNEVLRLQRPSFIVSTREVPEEPGQYPNTTEILSHGRAIGAAAGLQRIGLHVERLEPGHRTSLPHAHESEEEFVFVLEGEVDAWVDGTLHRMVAGDLAAFPAGTGIAHSFVNNGVQDALLLVGGEKSSGRDRLTYPLDRWRREAMRPGRWWDEAPQRPLGNAPAHAVRQETQDAGADSGAVHVGTSASRPAR